MIELELAPLIAVIATVVGVLYLSIVDKPSSKLSWIVPCGLSMLFFLVSFRAVVVEGPLGFWAEHTRNLWGNQIWFDLLLGVSAAIAFAIPRARKMEMRIVPWVLFILASGSIGLYAFIGRLLYLESRSSSVPTADRP